jgi:hypothetical protein
MEADHVDGGDYAGDHEYRQNEGDHAMPRVRMIGCHGLLSTLHGSIDGTLPSVAADEFVLVLPLPVSS